MSDDTLSTRKDPKTKKFLTDAMARFKLCAEAESRVRKDALDDLEFSIGDQWPSDLKTQRNLDGRPCLTINRLPQFIRQVTNEQRQQRPSIQISPIGDGADIETAEILQGIIRHIEVQSDAEVAYDTAYDQMVRAGFGYFRILTDYCGDDTFDQEIKIKRIKNQFKVYFDPASEEYDYSDARFAFIVEDVPTDAFKVDFPNATFSSLDEAMSVGDSPGPDWLSKDTIRVAEYFYIANEKKTLHIMGDGSVSEQVKDGETPQQSRESHTRIVKWCKFTALEVLDEKTLPGKFIPLVPVLGEDLDVNGKRHLAGLIRPAKDPQRAYNYWKSAATETIALAPRAPFIVAEGQLEGKKEYWRTANTKNWSYLEYKAVDAAGRPVPPPTRQTVEPPIQAMNEMLAGAVEDLQATTGIYNPSLGKTEGDQSGKAVLARQKQSDVSVLNFSDNFARSIRHAGRIILDLIPKIYDTPRVMRIIMPDETSKQVVTHVGEDQMQDAQAMLSQDIKKAFDIGTGRYDVAVSVGPSYQSKRQEAVASQMALVGAWPEGMQIIGDLLVRNMDWPGANEIADRLKKMLPPQLQGGDDGDPQAMLQQTQAQLQQIMGQHQQLVQMLNAANETIRTKQIEQQGRMNIEQMKIEAQITVAEINAKVQDAIERFKLERDMWSELHQAAHETALQAATPMPPPVPANGASSPTGGNTGSNPGATGNA